MGVSKINKIIYWFLSIVVLSIGSFLIIEDFDKEQIKIWDEASSAKNAIDMLRNGSLLAQYDDGIPVRDDYKPPLTLWFKMICYKLFGINEFSVRLPSIIASLLTMFLLWYFGFFILKKPELGILSALLLISSRGFVGYHVSRNGDPDAVLVFFVTGAVLSFFLLITNYPKSRNKYLLFFGSFVLLSIYTKSIMGIAPFAGIALYAILIKKGRKLIMDYRFIVTLFIIFAVTSLYYIAREIIDPGYFKGVLKYEIFSFKDYPGGKLKHPEFSFYFNYLLSESFRPFFYTVPLFLTAFFLPKESILKKLILYSLLGATVFLLGMSLSKMKNEWYISPIYPYLCILTASSILGLQTIVSKLLNHRFMVFYNIIIYLMIAYLVVKPVKIIHKANHKYENNNTYGYEREGKFLRDIKYKNPGYYNFTITSQQQRQLKFYTKKFNYEDGTKSKIYRTLQENHVGDTLLICDNKQLRKVYFDYKFEILLSDEYCKLFRIIEFKPVSCFDTIFCNSEILNSKGELLALNKDTSLTFYNSGLTSKHSFSGNSSLLTNEREPLAFNVEIDLNNDMDIIVAKVWRQKDSNNGFLIIQSSDPKFFTKSQKIINTKGEWEQIENVYYIPKGSSGLKIKIYVWNDSKNEICFDDLEIIIA